jgi:hypothetical protein
VVASVVLLDVVDAILPRALLRKLSNRLEAGGLLRLLITLLAARRAVLVLFASLTFMPCAFVQDTHFVAT